MVDHRYRIHTTGKIILRPRHEPKSLRNQYQLQNDTQIRKDQKVVENDGRLEVKNKVS